MKSREWTLLLDILLDLVSIPDIGDETREKLAKLIDYVGKIK